ncbi:MAG: thiol:disulfide interchange protein [Desulfovibrio sp.]|nr:thiol:disulfide interchange protein [Desulfovibrio sp.]
MAEFSASALPSQLASSSSVPQDPDKGPRGGLLLALTLVPPQGHYLYGPHSAEGIPTSLEARFASLAAVPMRESAGIFARIDSEGASLSVRFPAPTPKKATSYASVILPGFGASNPSIYPGPVTFWTSFPAPEGLEGAAVKVELGGLLCSDRNCAPVSGVLPLLFSARDVETFPAAEEQNWWTDYRAGADVFILAQDPAESPGFGARGGVAELRPTPQADPFFSGGAMAADVTAELGKTGRIEAGSLFSGLEPVFLDAGQEIAFFGEALFFGLLAGLLLNLMPCVLPVISLKFSALMSVSAMNDKEEQSRAFRVHCLIFAAGIMTWFGILSLLLGMAGWAWGEIFQQPLVIVVIALVLFILGLSLFGVFHLPLFDLRIRSERHPHWQSFAGGLLATLLATPCSGPLLGGVLAWAILQPLPQLVLTVASVGLGMASPYVLLSLWPRLVHLLPRPGTWTLRLEQLMGFFLMGSVAYFSTLLPDEWIAPFVVTLFALAFAAWLWGQIGHLRATRPRRLIARAASLGVMGCALLYGLNAINPDQSWERFDSGIFLSSLGKEAMLLEFTADWCPSCKAMEYTTLRRSRMENLRKLYNVRTIKVDLTRDAFEGNELLKALRSTSIPVLALFPKGENAKQPVILRDLVTPGQLDEAAAFVYANKNGNVAGGILSSAGNAFPARTGHGVLPDQGGRR